MEPALVARGGPVEAVATAATAVGPPAGAKGPVAEPVADGPGDPAVTPDHDNTLDLAPPRQPGPVTAAAPDGMAAVVAPSPQPPPDRATPTTTSAPTLAAAARPECSAPPQRSALGELLDGVDVMVQVLGDVAAVRLGPDGQERVDLATQKSLEAIVYLALREAPVDRDDLQAALWPDGTNSPKTLHNTVWTARRCLGTGHDGAELLPEPSEGRYRLSERVVSDYGLFYELVARARETGDADATAALMWEALALVRGEPFVGVGRGYAWVAPHAGMIVAQVADAAEAAAAGRLAAGDWRAATWAARQGLRAFPGEERLYRLLMRAAHTSGSTVGVRHVFAELLTRLADPDDDGGPDDLVHPDTLALLDELVGQPARA